MSTFLDWLTMIQALMLGLLLGAVIGGSWWWAASWFVALMVLEVLHGFAGRD